MRNLQGIIAISNYFSLAKEATPTSNFEISFSCLNTTDALSRSKECYSKMSQPVEHNINFQSHLAFLCSDPPLLRVGIISCNF